KMETNYLPEKKILTTPKDKVRRQDINFKNSLEDSEDLFIDVSSISCITGPKLILNEEYRGK
ncbi:MAG: hypothetical protein AABW67_01515, partial [Nanoarchaeota archaeon]